MKDSREYLEKLGRIKRKILSETWTKTKLIKTMMVFQENGVTEQHFNTIGDGEIKPAHALSMIIQTLDMTRYPQEHTSPRKSANRLGQILSRL